MSDTLAIQYADDLSGDAFLEEAREWLKANVPQRWRESRGALSHAESDAIRREWDRQLGRSGYTGISFPKEYGGQGMTLRDDVIFHLIAAEAQAPDGFTRVGKTLLAPMLITQGSEEQRRKYLPALMSGEEVWCQGFSEPNAGSDLANLTTRARKVDGGYLVKGRKTWTTFAQHASRCFLLAVTDPNAARYRNMSMLLVDMSAPGVHVTDIRQISGATHFAEVQFDDVFVPEDDLVGEKNRGWHVAMKLLENERGGVESAARYVEIRADMDLLLTSCADRPELRTELTALDIRTEIVRWHLAKVLDLIESDSPRLGQAVSVLKLLWSELWQDVTRAGVTAMVPDDREHWLYQFLESKAVTIYGGSSEILRNVASERVLGLPR